VNYLFPIYKTENLLLQHFYIYYIILNFKITWNGILDFFKDIIIYLYAESSFINLKYLQKDIIKF